MPGEMKGMTSLLNENGRSVTKSGRRPGVIDGDGYRFYNRSCLKMPQCADESIALTVTSPPYWNAIDYDIHTENGDDAWHRQSW